MKQMMFGHSNLSLLHSTKSDNDFLFFCGMLPGTEVEHAAVSWSGSNLVEQAAVVLQCSNVGANNSLAAQWRSWATCGATAPCWARLSLKSGRGTDMCCDATWYTGNFRRSLSWAAPWNACTGSLNLVFGGNVFLVAVELGTSRSKASADTKTIRKQLSLLRNANANERGIQLPGWANIKSLRSVPVQYYFVKECYLRISVSHLCSSITFLNNLFFPIFGLPVMVSWIFAW